MTFTLVEKGDGRCEGFLSNCCENKKYEHLPVWLSEREQKFSKAKMKTKLAFIGMSKSKNVSVCYKYKYLHIINS
jgi:hypothetical protein